LFTSDTTVETRPNPADALPILRWHPEYITPERRANYERLIAAKESGLLAFDAVPMYVRFELHAGCNLRCCWAQRNPSHPALRPRGAATPALARRIVDEIGKELFQATLFQWGEPTLNPRLPEIARIFHEANIATSVHSNMMLIDRALADALVASGLDEISASIDGVSQESYATYRTGGDVQRALRGLAEVVDARARAGSRTPRIAWQFLVFEHNQHEVERARELAAEIGVDEFRCWGGSGRAWSPAAGLGERIVRPRPEVLCADPWQYLAIDWDGAVHLCCRAFKAEHVMGDLRDGDIKLIFSNERFQLARRVIRDGYVPEPHEKITCTACNRVTDHVPEIAALGHKTSVD
jgi:pyruvate-formate lyase-activating enzyme